MTGYNAGVVLTLCVKFAGLGLVFISKVSTNLFLQADAHTAINRFSSVWYNACNVSRYLMGPNLVQSVCKGSIRVPQESLSKLQNFDL